MLARKFVSFAVLLALGITARAGAQEKMPMKLVATTPLPGFTGDFDHFAVDLKGKRLFLTAEDHKTVEVFDLDGKPIKSIEGFGQPHAILFMPDVNKFIVTDGDDFGMVELVSGEDYKILDKIKLPLGVDGAVFNPVTKYYYVESGAEEKGAQNHKINIIDSKAFKLVGDIQKLEQATCWPRERIVDYLKIDDRSENWSKFEYVANDDGTDEMPVY